MAAITLSSISGNSMEEILNAIERQRKDIEFIMANLDDDNIKEVSGKKVVNLEIDQAQIKNLLVDAANIKDLAVSSAKIANASITSAKIEDAAITNAKIDRATINKLVVTTADIADANITTAKIKDANITTAKIGDAQITTAKIGDAQITNAKIGDAQITNAKIDRASVNKLVVVSADIQDAAITTAKIGSAQITTAHIQQAQITGALIANATILTANIADAQITAAKIGTAAIETAKIKDASITSAKIGTGQITTALIANAAITTALIKDGSIIDAHIVGLTANKITAGTIDASIINVTNLVADNIVTGTITIASANILENTKFISDTSLKWLFSGPTVKDTTVLFEGVNTAKTILSGQTSSVWQGIAQILPCSPGEKVIGSIYTMTDNVTTIDSAVAFEIIFLNSAGSRISTHGTNCGPSTNNVWTRYISGGYTAPAGTVNVQFFAWVQKNGRVWFAKPMLQKGNLATVWQPHTNELLADKGITNLQIGDSAVDNRVITANTITGDKIVADAITAREIAAGTITAASGIIASATIGTAQIIDAAITTAKIGDAQITNAKIGSLDAGKITTGYLDAARIKIGAGVKFDPGYNPANGDVGYLTINPTFADWSSTFPTGFSAWNSTPTKETIITRHENAVRFNVTTAATQAGMHFNNTGLVKENTAPAKYLVVELDFYLASGSPEAAGVLIDWNGMNPYRTQYKLQDMVTETIQIGKWYSAKKVFKRPTDTLTGFTYIGGYLMGNYGGLGTSSAKDIIYERFAVREASESEIYLVEGKVDWDTNKSLVDGWKYPGTTYIDGGDIYTNSVTANQIASKTITANQIAATTITGNEIAARTITAAKIATGTITANEVAASTITADKINVVSLSAISANIGNITAGNITGVSMNLGGGKFVVDGGNVSFSGDLSGASGTFSGKVTAQQLLVEPTGNTMAELKLKLYESSPGVPKWLTITGRNGGVVGSTARIGDTFDRTAGTMTNVGALYISSNFTEFNGDVSIVGDISLLNGNITQRSVTTPTFLNSWTHYGSGYQDIGYYLGRNGRVYLQGTAKSGLIGYAMFQLPVGLRPSARRYMRGNGASGLIRIDVDINGYVFVMPDYGATNVLVSLEGISFRL